MSIDRFFSKVYDRKRYNCAHFTAQVWEYLKGVDISEALKTFMVAPSDRTVNLSVMKRFKKLNEPESPCIVLMQRAKTVPHLGVFHNNKVLQLHERGVEFMPLSIATRGFTKVGFYSC